VTAYLDPHAAGRAHSELWCMLLLDEKSLRVLAFSENTAEMLGYAKPEESFIAAQMEGPTPEEEGSG